MQPRETGKPPPKAVFSRPENPQENSTIAIGQRDRSFLEEKNAAHQPPTVYRESMASRR
ncbi:MAG: hypothetical protein AAGA60_17885 [Cyanobacteria bacterium P01_E01_bin.42]